MKLLGTLLCLLVLASCSGCLGWSPIKPDDKPPEVISDIVFHEYCNYGAAYCMVIKDGVLYFYGSGSVTAYDLEAKCKVWVADIASQGSHVFGTPCITGSHVYIPGNNHGDPRDIFELSRTTGAIERVICVDSTLPDNMVRGENIQCYNNWLFFSDESGFSCIDLQNLTKGEDGIYRGPVETIWAFPPAPPDAPTDNTWYYQILDLAFKDDFGYFSWYHLWETPAIGGRTGVDLATRTVLWEREGESSSSFISGTTIYSQACGKYQYLTYIDILSGALLKKIPNIHGADSPAIVASNKLYITHPSSGVVEEAEGEKSLYCLDATTGNMLWFRPSEYTFKGAVRGMTPQVNNGILYVPNALDMELFDVDTGELLACDSTVWGDLFSLGNTVRYKDIMVVSSGTQMWGIRMNWKRGPSGLVKQ